MGRPETKIVLTKKQQKFAARWAHTLEPYCREAVKRGIIERHEADDLFDYLQQELCRTASRYDGRRSHDGDEWKFLKMVLRQRAFTFARLQKGLRKVHLQQYPEVEDDVLFEELITAKQQHKHVVHYALGNAIEDSPIDSRTKKIMAGVLNGASCRKIGKELHLSGERIRQLALQGIRALRKSFAANGLTEESFYEVKYGV